MIVLRNINSNMDYDLHKTSKGNPRFGWEFKMHISNLFPIILQWNFVCLYISMQNFIERSVGKNREIYIWNFHLSLRFFWGALWIWPLETTCAKWTQNFLQKWSFTFLSIPWRELKIIFLLLPWGKKSPI